MVTETELMMLVLNLSNVKGSVHYFIGFIKVLFLNFV